MTTNPPFFQGSATGKATRTPCTPRYSSTGTTFLGAERMALLSSTQNPQFSESIWPIWQAKFNRTQKTRGSCFSMLGMNGLKGITSSQTTGTDEDTWKRSGAFVAEEPLAGRLAHLLSFHRRRRKIATPQWHSVASYAELLGARRPSILWLHEPEQLPPNTELLFPELVNA